MKPRLFFITSEEDADTVFKNHVSVRNHDLSNESGDRCRFETMVAGVATASKYGRHGVHPRSIGTIETGLETVADGSQVGDMPVFVETLADQHQASNLSANVAASGD
ncbi:bacterio-opsin activator domain-containing protein [Natronorubrum bangense]|nr:PAS sensor protein [Natronorubrum bangense JCM 10635]